MAVVGRPAASRAAAIRLTLSGRQLPAAPAEAFSAGTRWRQTKDNQITGWEPRAPAQPQRQRQSDEQQEVFSLSFRSTLVIDNDKFSSLGWMGSFAQQVMLSKMPCLQPAVADTHVRHRHLAF